MITTLALSALLLGTAPPEGAPRPAFHLAQAGEAPAAAAPAQRPRRPVRRRPPRRAAPNPQTDEVIAPAPSPAPAPQADVAPMPNRDIEAPRAPTPRETTQVRPDLIRPRSLPDARGQFESDYARERDSLFREPAAGARMNIPFSY